MQIRTSLAMFEGVVIRRIFARAVALVALTTTLACGSEVARGQSARDARSPRTTAPGVHGDTAGAVAATSHRRADVPATPPATPVVQSVDAASPDPATADAAADESVFGRALPIEDPSGRALQAFHGALARAALGEGQARIAFYGASHVASDMFTGPIRRRLQERFGDAGPGFVLPAKPWRWYRHDGILIERGRGWKESRVRAAAPKDDVYGLAGVTLDIAKRFATAAIKTHDNGTVQGHGALYELWYLKQPGGGNLAVFIDGKRVGKVNTRGDRPEPGYALFEVEEGHHRFELRAHGDGPVRIFGLSIERPVPGVVLDTLGIPGSRARYHLNWDDAVYRAHLARRQPDLVVLAYGTNESGDDDVPIELYEERLRKVLARIRETVPNASCLLIGPSDRPIRNTDTRPPTFEPRPRTGQLVEAQRRLSAEFGCGFFDLVGFMGGEMSMLRWVAAEPPMATPDYVHFTRLGYERLGEVLYDALLRGFVAPVPPAEPGPGAPTTPIAKTTSASPATDARGTARTP